MPKIIEDAGLNILDTAKRQLFAVGYSRLSLRSIASDCGIAVGTIYNYYQSKDMLIASIMLSDWIEALQVMKEKAAAAPDVVSLFSCMYISIVNYSNIYRCVWSEYTLTGNAWPGQAQSHKLLRTQLSEIIMENLRRLECDFDNDMADFLSESLLTVSWQDDMDFGILSTVLERIFRIK
ncbi:MAG: helix-turn-helix transcriptional regulator [Clostridiales bacterium]|nr:helix-turn-helix transcriptional regulator [Clostridiales bacterium]